MKKTRLIIGLALAFVMAFSVVCLTGCGDPYAEQNEEIVAHFMDGGFEVDSLTINDSGDKYDTVLTTPDKSKTGEFIAEYMEGGGDLFYQCKYKNDEGNDAVIEAGSVQIDGCEYTQKDDAIYKGAIRVYPAYVEEDMPENGKIFENNFGSRPTYIKVTNPNDDAYVIKFKDKDGKLMISFFVAPNSDVTTYMGTGDYYLSYATGSKWYGYDDLFGGSTVCCKDDEVWQFTSSQYWTLQLQKTEDGNVHVDPMDAGDF